MARVPNHNRLRKPNMAGLGLQHGDPVYDQYGQFMYNYMDPAVVANPSAYAPPPPAVAFYIPSAPGAAPAPNTSYGYVAPPPPTVVYNPTATPNSGTSFGGGGPTPAPPPQTPAPTPAPTAAPETTRAAPAPYYFSSAAASAAGRAFREFALANHSSVAGMDKIAQYMKTYGISYQLAAEYMNPAPGDTLAAASQRTYNQFASLGYSFDSNGIPYKPAAPTSAPAATPAPSTSPSGSTNRIAQIKQALSAIPNNRPDLVMEFIYANDVTYDELLSAMGWTKNQVDKILASAAGTSGPAGGSSTGTVTDPYAGGGSGSPGGGNNFAPGAPEYTGEQDNTMLFAGLGLALVGGLLMNGDKKTSRRRTSRARRK